MRYVFKRGDEIKTRNGWNFVVSEVKLWDKDDGEVHGCVIDKSGRRSKPRYLGTVHGLRLADDFYNNLT